MASRHSGREELPRGAAVAVKSSKSCPWMGQLRCGRDSGGAGERKKLEHSSRVPIPPRWRAPAEQDSEHQVGVKAASFRAVESQTPSEPSPGLVSAQTGPSPVQTGSPWLQPSTNWQLQPKAPEHGSAGSAGLGRHQAACEDHRVGLDDPRGSRPTQVLL